jgi:hypothetical protein
LVEKLRLFLLFTFHEQRRKMNIMDPKIRRVIPTTAVVLKAFNAREECVFECTDLAKILLYREAPRMRSDLRTLVASLEPGWLVYDNKSAAHLREYVASVRAAALRTLIKTSSDGTSGVDLD